MTENSFTELALSWEEGGGGREEGGTSAIENRALRVSETVAVEPAARPILGLLQSSKG